MSVQMVCITNEPISDVQTACARAGANLTEAITADLPQPLGTSEALNAFCEQAQRLKTLMARYGAVVTNDAATLQSAVEQFKNWDNQTASTYHNN